MKYARKQPTNDAASARGVERLLDATLDRLHTAEPPPKMTSRRAKQSTL